MCDQLAAGQQALIAAAATLAGIYAGADEDTMISLQGFAESLLAIDAGGIEAGLAELTKTVGAAPGSALRKS